MHNKGVFISFEGLDGCGKSTQVSMLKDYLSTIKCKSFFIKGHPAYNGVKEQIINSFGYIDPIAMFLLTMAKHKVVRELRDSLIQYCRCFSSLRLHFLLIRLQRLLYGEKET